MYSEELVRVFAEQRSPFIYRHSIRESVHVTEVQRALLHVSGKEEGIKLTCVLYNFYLLSVVTTIIIASL